MIDHPLLSFKELSDDELLNKTSEIHAKLNKAFMWGSSTDIITQLQWMLEMIDEERDERLARQSFQATQSMFPEVVESDPSFTKEKTEEPQSNSRVVKPAAKKFQDVATPQFDKKYIAPETKASKPGGHGDKDSDKPNT